MTRIRAIGSIRHGQSVVMVPQYTQSSNRRIMVNLELLNRMYALHHLQLTPAQRDRLERAIIEDGRTLCG